ncbi:MAG: NlpC/P60 family protein, partial [Christensenellales bacterium]
YGCYYAAKGSNTLTWNGKNSSGKTISSSLYPVYIKSYAMDDAGNRSSYTTLVRINAAISVDTQPPVLTSAGTATYDCKALPTKTYTYSVSEKAGVNPIAYDKNGNIVKDYGCYYAAKGSNTLTWNGKNSSGKTISSSLYPVYIKSYAMDDAGNRSSYTTLVRINAAVSVDTQPPVLTSAGTATYDCKALPTKTYTYSVSEKAGVNPIAYDKNGNIVKDYGCYYAAKGSNTLTWNGKNSSGKTISSSLYPVYIKSYAMDDSGNRSSYTTLVRINAAVSVDTQPPVLTSAGAVAYDCGTLPTSTYTYTVSKKAGVNPIAYDKNGNIVKDYGCYYAAKGSNTLIWNGKNSSGKAIPIDLYPVYIRTYAVDNEGRWSLYTDIVKILGGNSLLLPTLSFQGESTYNLGTLSETKYPFNVSGQASISAFAYDKSGDLIRSLGSISVPSGTNNIKWNGKDSENLIVTLSRYPVTIKASAKDLFGNVSKLTTIANIKGEVKFTPVTNNPQISIFLNIALQQYGAPYVLGKEGDDPSNLEFDCSGFIYYCLNNAGYTVPRLSANSYSKYSSWLYVSKDNLQPGDLMFYYSDTDPNRIGHVGIYLGNGYHIHASSSYEGVIICQIDGWYKDMLSHGRRVF